MLLRRDQVPFPNNPACKQCANKPCHLLFAGPVYPGKIIFVHRSKFVRLPCYAPSLEEKKEGHPVFSWVPTIYCGYNNS